MNNINGLSNILNQKIDQNPKAQDLKLRESAEQLEGVFLHYFLKPMEETMTKGMMGESSEPNLAKNMFSQVMSKALTENNNIGLSNQIYDHLKRAQANQNNNIDFETNKPQFINLNEK